MGDAVGAFGNMATNISAANGGGGSGYRRIVGDSAIKFRSCQPVYVGYGNSIAVNVLRLGERFACYDIDFECSITTEQFFGNHIGALRQFSVSSEFN